MKLEAGVLKNLGDLKYIGFQKKLNVESVTKNYESISAHSVNCKNKYGTIYMWDYLPLTP